VPDTRILKQLNDNLPPCVQVMGGRIVAFDPQQQTVSTSFDIALQFCHSGNVVQGGFVTGMLDATMAHAVFASLGYLCPVPSLEIKVSFVAPSLAGKFTAQGRVVKLGKSIAFLEASLFDSDGELTAVASSTARVIRPKS
jgi:uncharacterized protein (TIGR00369 family)